MTRAILILAMLFPLPVLAQEGTILQEASADDSTVVREAPTSQRTAPAPVARQNAKRRPSMVGYIDNGLVESRVRVRFDAGFHNDRPDRAEFFYAKCGCYKGLAQAIPPAFDPNAPGPGPAVPTTVDFQQLYLDAEYAATSRISVFGEIPLRWIQPQAFQPIPPFAAWSSQGGLGDIRAGVKLGIVSSPTSAITVQVRGYFPSGSASKGLGTDHGAIEPALLFHQQFSDRGALEGQIGGWYPTGGSAGVPTVSSDKFSGDVFYYGIGPSYEVYRSNAVRLAPVVELVGWNVRGGFLTLPGGPVSGAADNASGTNIVNLKFGARVVMRDASSLYVGYGRALTDAVWYKDIVRIEYRYSF
jgi:hypothetical protein